MLSLTREQNVRFFFLFPSALASNLLLYSHFPIITEAYKLPKGTIPDHLMFPAFSRCLPP